jgi:hypothetical protein
LVRGDPAALAANEVLYRDAEDGLIVVDGFGTSVARLCHLDVLTVEEIEDIRSLRPRHVPVLDRLFERARQHLAEQVAEWLPQGHQVDELITAGFNYPVSVRQLHLHVIVPPFKHERIFTFPRWHSWERVRRDLLQHGEVRLQSADSPEDRTEGEAVLRHALENNARAKQWVQEAEERKRQASQSKPAHA